MKPFVTLLTALLSLTPGAAPAAGQLGCIIKSAYPAHRLHQSTGDAALDRKFRNESRKLSEFFGVQPNVLLLDEAEGPNAYAAAVDSRAGYTGTVYFGVRLLGDELFDRDKGPTAVAGILAHEFAHILQMYRTGMQPGKQMELHADFMAGWFLARKNRVKPVNMDAFARSLYEKGDKYFWSPAPHGTPEERLNAMLAGYGSADMAMSEAFDVGRSAVQSKAIASGSLRDALLRQAELSLKDEINRHDSQAGVAIARNIVEIAERYLADSKSSLAAHIIDVWSGSRGSVAHNNRCPICSAVLLQLVEDTALQGP